MFGFDNANNGYWFCNYLAFPGSRTVYGSVTLGGTGNNGYYGISFSTTSSATNKLSGTLLASSAASFFGIYDEVQGQWGMYYQATGQNFYTYATNAYKATAGAWIAYSDQRLKKNIQDHTHGMDILRKLQPRTFQFNGTGGYHDDGKVHVGLIAQEALAAHPTGTMVFTPMVDVNEPTYKERMAKGTVPPPDYLVYDPSELTYILINAVKELDARVASLEKQLASKTLPSG
jgi:hypothetical protein